MILDVLTPALLALAIPALIAADVPQRATRAGQLRVQERVVIRIPRMPAVPVAPALPTPTRWKEKKGPQCVAIGELAGALISKPGTIDFVVAGGERFRAELGDDCPTLGFYSGFYMKPTRDGLACADRDTIRSRSGRACPIERYRRLVPRR